MKMSVYLIFFLLFPLKKILKHVNLFTSIRCLFYIEEEEENKGEIKILYDKQKKQVLFLL
jgi:hypothetical protein